MVPLRTSICWILKFPLIKPNPQKKTHRQEAFSAFLLHLHDAASNQSHQHTCRCEPPVGPSIWKGGLVVLGGLGKSPRNW